VGVSLDTLTPDTNFVFTALSGTEGIAGIVSAPEPGTLALLPAGIALLILMRKRFARPFPTDEHVSNVADPRNIS
jgi:hypothetical protein